MYVGSKFVVGSSLFAVSCGGVKMMSFFRFFEPNNRTHTFARAPWLLQVHTRTADNALWSILTCTVWCSIQSTPSGCWGTFVRFCRDITVIRTYFVLKKLCVWLIPTALPSFLCVFFLTWMVSFFVVYCCSLVLSRKKGCLRHSFVKWPEYNATWEYIFTSVMKNQKLKNILFHRQDNTV